MDHTEQAALLPKTAIITPNVRLREAPMCHLLSQGQNGESSSEDWHTILCDIHPEFSDIRRNLGFTGYLCSDAVVEA